MDYKQLSLDDLRIDQAIDELLAECEEKGVDPAGVLARAIAREIIERLEALPPRLRDTVLVHIVEGFCDDDEA